MSFRVDELLLIENITYISDKAPLVSVLSAEGKTVREYIDSIDMDALVDEVDYTSFYNGFDWKNTLTAIKRNDAIMDSRIVDAHIDQAYGGGGGLAAVFINDAYNEAVVAFRGTATMEWADDMEGAAVTDTLQQINALEYFRTVVRRHDLTRYTITVTGHSKGGNKAKYITILDDTPDRCVSFDGQGFSDKFMNHYRERIIKRQDVIENHNVDYDYVNILMNDIGRATYYFGYDYGRGGFAEAHAPNTYFNFTALGEYNMRPNPAGQSTEMQLLDQFLNSMLRSMPNDKELGEAAELVGKITQTAFAKQADVINSIFDLVADPRYSDNVAFMIAFFIKYERLHPGFLSTIAGIMSHFGMDGVLKYIETIQSVLEWKSLDLVIGFTDFVVGHIPAPLLKKLQKYLYNKLGVSLEKEELRSVLSVVSMTNDALKNMSITDDGADIVISDEEDAAEEMFELPAQMDILVLAGGISLERNISLLTGHRVAETLRRKGHRVIILDTYLGYGSLNNDLTNAFEHPEEVSLQKVVEADVVPDLWAVKKRRRTSDSSLIGPNVIKFSRMADLIFIALPGSGNETGKIQGLFDLYGLDYTGSSALACSMAMNKSSAKQIFLANGVVTPKWRTIRKHDAEAHTLPAGLNYPVVVKPNSGGASIGVTVVNDDNTYAKALNEAFVWESEIIVEEYISGREFSVSIIGNEVYPVLEVNGKDGIFDAKHTLRQNSGDAYCPADLEEEILNQIKTAAKEAADCLGINSYSRVDFRMSTNGDLYCLECDALPALTESGRFARSVLAGGVGFDEMCEKIIEESLRGKYA